MAKQRRRTSTSKPDGGQRQRKAIFRELLAHERRVKAEAEVQYPLPEPPAGGYSSGDAAGIVAGVMTNQELYFREQQARYEAEVAEAHGLSADQLHAIVAEGVQKKWAVSLPSRE